ncbi:hypothetical protein [Vulcanisaeta sp. JCM 16161]|uniref:hypothetical protein n=1 Tax=Vulcanisaeta sp. JCM 16161 TaxID=1295372 RepID=UPI001FB4066B|nr:hypothetical protein [Vulcanisaeta sp. JCM 16161]
MASRLDNEEFPTFTLYTVLGDGDVNIKWKWVRLTMGHSKLELWGGLIERLESMGFKRRDDGYRMAHTVKSSKAVELAKKMLGDSAIKTLVEDLVQLPDAEKPRRLVALAGMEPKPKGKSMVEVAGIRMTIGVDNNGYVVLKVRRKDYEDARAVLERLKGAGYEEVELSRQGDRCVVYMGMDVIRKHPELVTKVCEVLRRMHEEAINKGEERRARSIARAMKKLGCPAQSPRAQ